MPKQYPVGSAQSTILHALGRDDIQTYQEAEAYFAEIGISVFPVRQGRRSVPEVKLKQARGGYSDSIGDWEDAPGRPTAEQMKALEPWLVKQ